MANTKKVPEEQIPMEDVNKEEVKSADTPVPAVEPTVTTEETPVKEDENVKEKKTKWRKLADWADAHDKKNADRLAAKQAKKTQKQKEKETSTTGAKLKKAGLIALGVVGAVGAGAVALAVANQSDDGVTYVDNGAPTTYIPEQTQSAPVEETSIEPAVTETNSSETAGTVVETTSNE